MTLPRTETEYTDTQQTESDSSNSHCNSHASDDGSNSSSISDSLGTGADREGEMEDIIIPEADYSLTNTLTYPVSSLVSPLLLPLAAPQPSPSVYHSISYSSASLFVESASERQILVHAHLWPHYERSKQTITQALKMLSRRVTAANKTVRPYMHILTNTNTSDIKYSLFC